MSRNTGGYTSRNTRTGRNTRNQHPSKGSKELK
uniref:Uncharacterized protein n=1 Tax=Anguilla anguilla TaxID=7936 RepID=A0A0E9T0H9_ANGAN